MDMGWVWVVVYICAFCWSLLGLGLVGLGWRYKGVEGTESYFQPFLTRLMTSWRQYGWNRFCCMSGNDMNPRDIRQVWLGGMSVRYSHLWSHTPMPETLVGPSNLPVFTNMFCRVGWVYYWNATNTLVHQTSKESLCCNLMYRALGRWLMFKFQTFKRWKHHVWKVGSMY
ncbi:hypothetical protein Hanom_Chr07g00600131 [Helianthus anomalus]